MSFVEIVIVAVGLAMDAFAVSLGTGTTEHVKGLRAAVRMSFHFGLFQALMPVIGWFLGTRILSLIASFDHWVAFGLLAFVGIRMLRSGVDPDPGATQADPSRGAMLVILSVATSIDALAVGLSLAVLGITIWYPVVVIGVVTAALSFIGSRLGRRLGVRFGKYMELAGGGVLILIGFRVLLSHLLV
jgi:putative Mn2+ efflux pump MntP